jgi:hypothetical protein
MSNSKNSWISLMEQISQLNKNSIEIITKLNDVVSTTNNNINVNMLESDGTITQYQMPSIGWLKKEIDIANSNIKKISTLSGDGTTIIVDDTSSRKIKSVDLNREPNQISNINLVSDFYQTNNWFFESLVNPLLSIKIDLNDISDDVNKVMSRRYIIKFEKDDNSNLTTNGQKSLDLFTSTFLNKNSFTIDEFTNWMSNPINTVGILNLDDVNKYRDDQYFDLDYREINYKGYFTVLKLEKDDLNKKLWYHLNTLSYYDRNGNTSYLANGDVLSINNNTSYTKYKILEVNTSSNLFRISVERIEGYDPIPIGNNVLEFYSELSRDKSVKISIGFDEYNVIFLKPINTDNYIIGSEWSNGTSFYSNDLILSNENINLVDYYIQNVYDYGMVIKDMVSKTIPSDLGIKPNIPTLVTDNFKVVQINKHLTDTKDYNTLKKLHSQKNSVKSKISEIEESITQKNLELQTKVYRSAAEKSKTQNELDKLVKSQDSETKLYSSYVNQITNSVVEAKAEPKFRVRGFWDFPEPIIVKNSKTQEVIGFEVQYRYSSKTGAENATEGFEFKKNTDTLTTSTRNKTAYFSKWVPIRTDIRKRLYDINTKTWVWETEDVGDADVPNVNQVDIPISRNERVQIRIRSISEVGYPDAMLYSDWSEILSIDFPDELNDVLGENTFIMNEANREQVKVSFENDLKSKGIPTHVRDSYYVNEQYVAHTDKNIATSFKDQYGNTIMLFDYIKQLNDKINSLEEIVKRAKGEIKITLFRNTDSYEIKNGTLYNIDIECQDYIKDNSSTISNLNFYNSIYLINDFYLKIENIANENDLGLLSYRETSDVFDGVDDSKLPTYYNEDGKIYKQVDNQYLWFLNNVNIDGTLQDLYHSVDTGTTSDVADDILSVDYLNVGYSGTTTIDLLLNNLYWSGTTSSDDLGATIHPYILKELNSNELVNTNNDYIKIIKPKTSVIIPIYIFFKMKLNDSATETIAKTDEPSTLTKAFRVKLENETAFRPFDFGVAFRLKRHKQYTLSTFSPISEITN